MVKDTASLGNKNRIFKRQIKNKNQEIADLKPFKTKHTQLVKDTASLSNKNRTLKGQIKTKNKEIADLKPFKTKHSKLTAEYKTIITFNVNTIVNSTDYNVKKTDELIVKCNNSTQYVGEAFVKPLIAKLEKYKKLSLAINQCKKTVSTAYTKTNCDKAISLLSDCSGVTKQQQNDYNKYKKLVKDYKKVNDGYNQKNKDLGYLKGDDPPLYKKEINKYLAKKVPLGYKYLWTKRTEGF